MVVMLNEEKISLMTKLALYEQKEGKKQIPMSGYYKGDYVSLNVLNSVIIGTIAYILIVGMIILINAEELVNKITEIDLVTVGKQILTYYVVFILCYAAIAYAFYSVKFKSVRVKLNQYNADLKKLYEMYKKEGSVKEDTMFSKELPVKKIKRARKVQAPEPVEESTDAELDEILQMIEE